MLGYTKKESINRDLKAVNKNKYKEQIPTYPLLVLDEALLKSMTQNEEGIKTHFYTATNVFSSLVSWKVCRCEVQIRAQIQVNSAIRDGVFCPCHSEIFLFMTV